MSKRLAYYHRTTDKLWLINRVTKVTRERTWFTVLDQKTKRESIPLYSINSNIVLVEINEEFDIVDHCYRKGHKIAKDEREVRKAN